MPWTQGLHVRAWHFAALAHAGQTMPDNDLPYLVHIGSVALEVTAALVAEGGNADLALPCAILHDTIEDTATSHAQLQAAFNRRIADGVLALSKDPAIPGKLEQMRDSLRRIREQAKEVWMVKLADRIANLSDPRPTWSSERRQAYADEARLILEELGEASDHLRLRLAWCIERFPID
ncbi:guanosine polyphosphate synthetase/pyrophosphohydrolase [Desulfocurvibacter africanus PCS]|uniref:Guanosine polyphosphate synthetase/pyrophosphohydrolase n=1 Tax=Desulfocurvibacter africanus PCS TaxID=1262666 RepID=M5PNJ1_DESAF|nr:HD domain-containing protein [Desulfocurvibacter africanus]EMG35697.1 guanosine polyphosphate synthetase/pyrophosphohydrolase [Desulfocurvibacter africanus PCS]